MSEFARHALKGPVAAGVVQPSACRERSPLEAACEGGHLAAADDHFHVDVAERGTVGKPLNGAICTMPFLISAAISSGSANIASQRVRRRAVCRQQPRCGSWHGYQVAEREVLQGGVANAGAVVREGAYVLRPPNPHSEAIHALFRHVRATGFDGVPEPVGFDLDGRERLVFIPGETAWPPFPAWCQTDTALGSIAELLARFHAAAQGFAAPIGATWNRELADPAGGSVICHNDVCVENVVFRDGVAVALLDFDFAAPGRPLYDLAAMARMCVPLDTPEDALVWGRESFDPFGRLRLVADSYGLPSGREELVDIIEESMARGGEFVRRRVERGEPAFVEMWGKMGGQARYNRRRDWFTKNRSRFVEILG